MRLTTPFCLSVVFGCCCAAQSLPASSGAASGMAILEQTRMIVQTALDEVFRQSGQLTVLTGPKALSGTYTYVSTGSLSRDEVVLPGYSEIRLRAGAEEKIQRSFDSSPLAVFAAIDAIHPIKWLQQLPDERITRMRKGKIAKLPTRCIDIRSKRADRSVCVYDDGTLAALRNEEGWNYEYSGYSTFQKTQLPGKIRGMENGAAVFELQMSAAQALAAGSDVRDDVVHPTVVLGWCKGLTRPVVEKEVVPRYPEAAKLSWVQGTVDLYGIIAADGHVDHLVTVRSAGPALDKSSLEAVTQWTFRPAMCGATPVTSEAIISVRYSINSP